VGIRIARLKDEISCNAGFGVGEADGCMPGYAVIRTGRQADGDSINGRHGAAGSIEGKGEGGGAYAEVRNRWPEVEVHGHDACEVTAKKDEGSRAIVDAEDARAARSQLKVYVGRLDDRFSSGVLEGEGAVQGLAHDGKIA